jgi:hypothetical protein
MFSQSNGQLTYSKGYVTEFLIQKLVMTVQINNYNITRHQIPYSEIGYDGTIIQ